MDSTLSQQHAPYTVRADSGGHSSARIAAQPASRASRLAFWVFTALFCLEMSFTAYYELLPQGAEAFARLGFPAGYFRVELSFAKLAGVAALLFPFVPARLKEWAYAGFAINLASALITHLALHQGPASWSPSAITSVLWGFSYYFWRRLQAGPGRA